MSLPRHVPQRMCIACGAKREQARLIRIVRGPEASLSIGASSRENGRGAYICPSRECWEKALRSTRLEHALRAKLTNENRAALLQYSSTLEEHDSNG
jgi:predicted RNA-binding protein YlxR (DUF448 family)